jgi:hypothetical protein
MRLLCWLKVSQADARSEQPSDCPLRKDPPARHFLFRAHREASNIVDGSRQWLRLERSLVAAAHACTARGQTRLKELLSQFIAASVDGQTTASEDKI